MDKTQLTPDIFKQKVITANPNAVASDGRKYSEIPAVELLKKALEKNPEATTKDGIKYSQFMQGDNFKAQSLADKTGISDSGVGKFGKGVFDFFTSATQALGQNAGQSIAAPENVQHYSDSLQSWSDINNNLQKAIESRKKAGADTSKLEKVMEEHNGVKPQLEDFVGIDTAQRMREGFVKNLEEVAGQGVGTVLEAMSGGIFESGAKTAVSKELSLGQKVIKGAKLGAGYGAAAGAAGSMQEKKGAGDVATSTAVGGVLGAGLGAALEGVIGGIPALSKFLKGVGAKSESEILSTVEKDAHKLNPVEREFYYKQKVADISKQAAEAEKLAKQKVVSAAEQAQTEAEKLLREQQVSARDVSIDLRPKAKKAFAEQSQTYRNLVEEELAPYKDVKVNNDELSSFVDSKYGADPERATQIKNKLGLGETEVPTSGRYGRMKVPGEAVGQETTIGEMYNKVKGLKKEISATSKKGSKVYTPNEKFTDDTISTLTDFMNSKGLDTSGSRKFWAEYAPVRDQLISELKPFNVAGTQTETFAKTLVDVAKGKDVNNENFIKEVSNLLGEDVTKEQKNIISKLDDVSKKKIASEVKYAEDKINIELEKKAKLENWSSEKLKIEQKSFRRKWIKRVIGTGVLLGLNWEGYHLFQGLTP